jgi:hypothetical protein
VVAVPGYSSGREWADYYRLMFEHLAVHQRIVVTGPQRSGTRIAAKMIAADTGHEFVDEFAFAIKDREQFREILRRDSIVVQAPHMLRDMVDDPPPGSLVVLMRRDLDHIHASAERIRWAEELGGNTTELRRFGLTEGDSAAVKYSYWDTHEKSVPFLELEYEALRSHPLFVPDEQRKAFGPLQTQP